MNDKTTSIKELKDSVGTFINDRNWAHHHSPKNISMSIVIEAAELLEKFQWLSEKESIALKNDKTEIDDIQDELSDILAYMLSLCNAFNIDLTSSFMKKMEKNKLKYPVKSRKIKR